MWSVDNRTPFAAGGAWIRDADGAEVWVVAVKATYDILPDGALRVTGRQVPVHLAPVPHPGLQSLASDTDLGPRRPGTDVLLVGHAHAPAGVPINELDVAWRVGPVKRCARIIGDRTRNPSVLANSLGSLIGDSSRTAQPFVRMPLVWERAQYHPDLNPVGCGHESGEDGRLCLPNVVELGGALLRRSDKADPIGFGPIASHWRPRRDHGGSYDAQWQQERNPLEPKDLHARHWHSAVPQQQVSPYLGGGEAVALRHLTPAGYVPNGLLACTLPRLGLSFETRFHDGSVEHARSVIHTVVLDTHELPRLIVVHHMVLPCHSRVNLLDRTIVRVKRRPLDRERENDEAGTTAAALGDLPEATA